MNQPIFEEGRLKCKCGITAFKLYKNIFREWAECSACGTEYLLSGVEDGDCSPELGFGHMRRCILVFKPEWEEDKEWICPSCGRKYKGFTHTTGKRWWLM